MRITYCVLRVACRASLYGIRSTQYVSPDAADQSLQIFSLGEGQQYRVVGRLCEPSDHRTIAPGVERRAEDHFLKEIGRDQPRARERRQDAARPQDLHGDQVDILIAARGPLDLPLRVGELGRVEDHHVELAALIAIL